MSKARVRLEYSQKHSFHNNSSDERYATRDQAFKAFLRNFNKQCDAYGISRSFKEHQYFESKPRKERRKRKEAHLRRLKDERDQLNEKFRKNNRENY